MVLIQNYAGDDLKSTPIRIESSNTDDYSYYVMHPKELGRSQWDSSIPGQDRKSLEYTVKEEHWNGENG